MSTASEIFFKQFRFLPGDHVLQPREVVFGQRLAQPDATVDAQWAEMVGGDRNVHAHHLAHRGDIVGHHGQTFFGDLGRHEHVLHGEAAVLLLNPLGPRDRSRCPGHQVDPQVHLHPGESLRLALLQALAEDFGIARFRGVAVDPDLVAELAAEHLVDGNVVRLARQVPERHFHSADAAALARVAAELLDLAEKLVDVAGVLAEDPALQLQRVILAGAIAHLAQAVDALVGIDSDDGRRHRHSPHHHHPHVGDLQIARFGIGVGVLRKRFQRFVNQESGGQRPGGFLKKGTPSVGGAASHTVELRSFFVIESLEPSQTHSSFNLRP